MPVVLIVGSLHYDIMVEADHLPRREKTAIGTRWCPKFGGKGGNQAVVAARAGAVSRMAGAIGDDGFGDHVRAHLRKGGVQDHVVVTLPGVASGLSVAIQDARGDYVATIVSGANGLILPDAVVQTDLWQDVGLLILQNEVPEAINIAAAHGARSRGIPTLLNAAPWRPLSTELRGLIDILVVNAVNAAMMGTGPVTSLATASDAARHLSAHFKTVIVTAGASGLAACGMRRCSYCPPNRFRWSAATAQATVSSGRWPPDWSRATPCQPHATWPPPPPHDMWRVNGAAVGVASSVIR